MAIACAVSRDYILAPPPAETPAPRTASHGDGYPKHKYSCPVIIPAAILPNSSGLYGSGASDDSHSLL